MTRNGLWTFFLLDLEVLNFWSIKMSEETTNIDEALAKNDEEWVKRLLLMVMIMIIALLGLD